MSIPLRIRVIPEAHKGAIARVLRGTDGIELLRYLAEEKEDAQERLLRETDDVKTRWLQATAQTLEDILGELERVSEVQRPVKTQK